MKIKKRSLVLSLTVSAIIVASAFVAGAQTIHKYRVLDQKVNDLVYSRSLKRIFASVPSTGGQYGNNVIAIDPFAGTVIGSVFVGSEPNKIALSDDESVLYVALDGAAAIRQLFTEPLSTGIVFGLGTGTFGPHYAEDIVVLPSLPNSIAVSRRNSCCSPRHEGVAIYDNGVMRSTTTPGHTGSNRIEPGAGPSVLYGYNNETTDFGFRRMSIDTFGISITSNLQNVIQGFSVEIKYGRGRIYATTGTIIDPVNNQLVGTFAVQGFMDGVEIDPAYDRVYFLDDATLKVFNTSTFQPAGSAALSLPGFSNGARLTRWGRLGLAYRATDSRLVLFETTLVPSGPSFTGEGPADLRELVRE
jgi:DNA-binding beta-propeller fold protein YncE